MQLLHVGPRAGTRELIYGGMATGKTTKAKELLTDDAANGIDAWIIDFHGQALPEWRDTATEHATTIGEAQALLRKLLDREPSQMASLTIEAASDVFTDKTCRELVTGILRYRDDVKVRLVVQALTPTLVAFRGSTLIRSLMFEGAVYAPATTPQAVA